MGLARRQGCAAFAALEKGDLSMKKLLLAAAAVAALVAAPANAADFSVFGSYWDTDVAGDTAGGGINLGIPLGEVVGLELRATYFEELTDDPLENAFDSDDPVFQEAGINVTPVEVGVRFNIPSGAAVRPYFSAGAGYYLLDSDFGEVDDEVGYYGALGLEFGDDEGMAFFAEALYRKAEGEVRLDPQDIDDIDDIDIDDRATFDLDGVGVNAGLRWHF
jgi:hypothetical protein